MASFGLTQNYIRDSMTPASQVLLTNNLVKLGVWDLSKTTTGKLEIFFLCTDVCRLSPADRVWQNRLWYYCIAFGLYYLW